MKKRLFLLLLATFMLVFVLTGCDWRGLFRGHGITPTPPQDPTLSNIPHSENIEFNVVTMTLLSDIQNADKQQDFEEYTNLVNVIKRIKNSVVEIYSQEKVVAHGVVIGKDEQKPLGEAQKTSTSTSLTETQEKQVLSYIATSHALVADLNDISIKRSDGTQKSAYLVGTDPDSDLCVLLVEEDLPAVEFYTDTTLIEMGEKVISIGNVLGADGETTTTSGIISANQLSVDQLGYSFNILSTDTMINEGSFGGGLFTNTGFFIGMVSGNFDKHFTTPTDMNFALSANDVLSISKQLVETRTVNSLGYIKGKYLLGIDCKDEFANRWGTQINVVVDNLDTSGCLYSSGLRQGDIIKTIEFKGNAFAPNKTQDLYDYINDCKFKIGDVFTLAISRNDTSRSVQVKIKQYIYQK